MTPPLSPVRRARVAKLVAALRSGRYPQARSRLRTERGYCCLGVACDVYRKATKRGRWKFDGPFDKEWNFTLPDMRRGEGSSADLPEAVKDWYGFPYTNPYLKTAAGKVTVTRTSATYLNDNAHLSFHEIADAFERTFLSSPAPKP